MQRRNTNQRKIVLNAIEQFGHVSTEGLVKFIQENDANISLATIYRNLNILLTEGLIKKIKLNEVDVFETVKENHYHFMCKCCKQIIDIPAKNFKVIGENEIEGNSIEEINVNLYGLCYRCKQFSEGEK